MAALKPSKELRFFIIGYDSEQDIKAKKGYFIDANSSLLVARQIAQSEEGKFYCVAIKDSNNVYHSIEPFKTPFEIGQHAFKNDIKAAAHDPEMMHWLAENTSGRVGSAVKPLEEWNAGFQHELNKSIEKEIFEILKDK